MYLGENKIEVIPSKVYEMLDKGWKLEQPKTKSKKEVKDNG